MFTLFITALALLFLVFMLLFSFNSWRQKFFIFLHNRQLKADFKKNKDKNKLLKEAFKNKQK